MDFAFVEASKAIAVVSCKSFTSTTLDKKYCNSLKEYDIENVILFAECCKSSSVTTIEKNAAKAGYKSFHYLYSLSKDGAIEQNEQNYLDFVAEVKGLFTKPVGRTRKK